MSEPFSVPPLAYAGDDSNPVAALIMWAKWQVTPRAAITVNYERTDGCLFSMFTDVDGTVEWVFNPTRDNLYVMWRYLEGCYAGAKP